MFSKEYPSWGCRGCKDIDDGYQHDLWDVYAVDGYADAIIKLTCSELAAIPYGKPIFGAKLVKGPKCLNINVHNRECGVQGKNFGTYYSPESCANVAQNNGYDYFMFSKSYPTWGCRGCNTDSTKASGGNQHNLWIVYAVYGCNESSSNLYLVHDGVRDKFISENDTFLNRYKIDKSKVNFDNNVLRIPEGT